MLKKFNDFSSKNIEVFNESMEEILESITDIFVDFCDRGEYFNYYKMTPNKGIFDKEFIIKFIDLVKNGAYSRDYEYTIKRGCEEALQDISLFCNLLKKEIVDNSGITWELDEPLVKNIIKSLDSII